METVAAVMLLHTTEVKAYFLFTATYDDFLPGIFEDDGYVYTTKMNHMFGAILRKQRPQLAKHLDGIACQAETEDFKRTGLTIPTALDKIGNHFLYRMLSHLCLLQFPLATTMRLWDLFYISGPEIIACALAAVLAIGEQDLLATEDLETMLNDTAFLMC